MANCQCATFVLARKTDNEGSNLILRAWGIDMRLELSRGTGIDLTQALVL